MDSSDLIQIFIPYIDIFANESVLDDSLILQKKGEGYQVIETEYRAATHGYIIHMKHIPDPLPSIKPRSEIEI